MKIKGDTVIFETTQKQSYANCGIIGLSPELKVYDGYDGEFSYDDMVTPEEKAELADYMIDLWTQYKAGIK